MKLICLIVFETFFYLVYLSTIKKESILYSKSLFKWNILKKEPSFLSSRQGYSLNLYNNKVIFFHTDFKKNNGQDIGVEISKKYNVYRQDYCGCIYSLRDKIKKDEYNNVK